MHESFRNVRPSWVAFGWFISVGLTSLILMALDSFGFIGENPTTESLWVALALLGGFLVTGIIVGTRVAAAPILHGVGIGLFSLLAWVAVNVFLGEPTGEATWRSLEATTTAGLLLLQGVASVVGTRIGVRSIRRLSRGT